MAGWLDLEGKTVIDFGCGSGILAIAALKLGAAKAIGIDIDPQAIQASRDNAERNGVSDRLELYLPDAQPEAMKADVVVANIPAGPLRELAPLISVLPVEGGLLGLSGILASRSRVVKPTPISLRSTRWSKKSGVASPVVKISVWRGRLTTPFLRFFSRLLPFFDKITPQITMLIIDLDNKIHRKNMMKHISGKAALLALSMISATAYASHWSYQGEGAPEHWGELDEAYKTCKSGMYQSPVNIDNTVKAHISPLETHYIDGPVILTNNGHTIRASENADTRDSITLDKQRWTLQQFHFHAPSENTVHGKNTQWKCIWSIKR